MKRLTKEQVALGATTFIVHFSVCMFGIIPRLHDMENWAPWKYVLLAFALLCVAHAVTETVTFIWGIAARAIVKRKGRE